MRVYFLSCLPAALKLNGLYLGTVDCFERHVELDPDDGVLAEIIPGNNMQPLNFFLNKKFFSKPPDFADVYLTDGDAVIYIRKFAPKDTALSVIYQTRFSGNLVTIFRQGGVYLSVEGADYSLDPLPTQFAEVRAEVQSIAGRSILAVYGEDYLLIISDSGKTVFLNAVESAQFGDRLKIVTAFETCTAAKAECEFNYDGEKLTLTSGKTIETRPPEPQIVHFAFFESILTRGDYENYLCEELRPRAKELIGYLGEFVSVTVPHEKFYLKHGNLPCAGLVYPKSENLYEIKYFAVELGDGKICNVYPVE